MKEVTKKFIACFVVIILMLNSYASVIISTAAEVIENIIDENKIKGIYEVTLEKYANYEIQDMQDQTGVLLQYDLKTGIEYLDEQEYETLNSTGVLLQFPKIENVYPEKIEVQGISTKATNGNEEAKDWAYVYDKENGELKIGTFNNVDENGEIYNQNDKDARDEYRIICYYGENAYAEDKRNRELEITGILQFNIKNNDDEIKKRTEIKSTNTVTENVDGLISTQVNTSDIYNGFVKSNANNNTGYKTNYIENLKINVSYKDNYDEAIIKTNNYIVKTEETNKIKNEIEEETKDIIYTKSEINKNEILSRLGENGYLKVYDQDDDLLGEINKDTETNENGIVEFRYEKEVTNLKIVISRPEQIGNIEIKNERQIKETLREENINEIQVKNNISLLKNEKETIKKINEETQQEEEIEREYQKEIYSFESVDVEELKDSETKMDVSVDKTDWTNNVQNDVTFTATLVTNDIKYSLFKNPTITIKMPSEVEKVILGDVSVLYDENLQIANTEVIEEDGCKVIKISLNGEQNQYIIDSLVNGANIVIPATVIVKKDVSSVDTQVKINCINGNKSFSKNESKKEIDIHVETKSEIVQNATVEFNQDNSYKNTVNGLETEIIAQVGNDILSENDTVYEGESIVFTVRMKNQTEGAMNHVKMVYEIPDGTVYVTRNSKYSDQQIEGSNEYYTNGIYRKYPTMDKVEIEKDELAAGEIYEKKYQILIEKNPSLIEENNIQNYFKFYIDNNEVNNQTINLNVKSAKLSIDLYPEQIEYFGRYSYFYEMDVNNLTNDNLENITVEVVLGKELEYKSVQAVGSSSQIYDKNTGILKLKYDKINANETKKIAVRAQANQFEDNKYIYNVKLYVRASCDNENVYRSDLDESQVETTYFSIIQSSEKEGKELRYGEEVEYNFIVKNEGNIGTIIKIEDSLPEGIVGISAEYEYFKLQDDNKTFKKLVNKTDISHKMTIDGDVQPDLKLETYVPEGESIIIKIKAKADSVFKTTEVVNVATVSGDEIFPRISNGIKNTILYFGYEEDTKPDNPDTPDNPDNPDTPDNPEDPEDPNDPDSPDNPSDENTYGISGVVWLDSNKDGKRDEDEKLLEGITVKLFDVKTNKIVVDNNNNPKKVITDKNGSYVFEEINNGKYIVLFEYDVNKYSITSYKKNNISEKVNSDAIEKEVNIDGKIYRAGITDTINLYQNYSNIDMGLIENNVFDLKLDKYVSKITTKYNGVDKIYQYNNSKLAKIEIPSKQLDNTTVTIEYKIVVTNEGNTSGYIKEINDYIPDGLSFDSNSNKDWKKNSNGDIIYTGLIDEKIEPGEAKEVTLTLVAKKVTKNVINAAEIGKSYNVNNLKDVDSNENNKDENEDDYSTAEVIISIKTGVLVNVLKILGCIILLAIIFFGIKKYKNLGKLLAILILFINIISFLPKNTFAGVTVGVTYGDLKYHIRNGAWELVKADGKYWCINPGVHLCGLLHAYDMNWVGNFTSNEELVTAISGNYGVTVPNLGINVYPADTTPIDIGESQSSESAIKCSFYNNSKILVGPYKFDWTYSNTQMTSYEILDNNGTNITSSVSICDAQGNKKNGGLPKGEEFYLLVSSTVDSVKININLSASEKRSGVRGGYNVLTPISGGEGYCSETITQTLFYIAVEPYEVTVTDTATLTWTKKIPKGKIEITKKDKDSDNNLKGAKFKITGLDEGVNSKYSKTVTIDTNPYIIENLLVGRYEVEETSTPSGYVLDLQDENEKKREVTVKQYKVKSDGTKVICRLTAKNKQYGDLRIIKADQETYDKMNGVGFLIFKDDSDGTRKYIKSYKYKQKEPAIVTWTTDINKAKCFYSGEKDSEVDGYITGNVSSSDGTVLLKNLPIRDGSSTKIKYYAQEYRFDYDKNPELIYYKLDKSKVISKKLVTNASGKSMDDGDRIALLQRATRNFLETDYIRNQLNGIPIDVMANELYVRICQSAPSADFINLIYNQFNGFDPNNGYTKENMERFVDLIFESNTTMATISKNIFANDDAIKQYRDRLCSIVDIKAGSIQTSMREYLYYSLKGQTIFLMKNKQYTIDVRGYVWEDIQVSKQTKRNDLYKNDDADIKDLPASDVTVRLYAELNQNGGLPTLVATTDEDGNYKFKGAQFVLDANGNKVLDENGDPKIQYNIIIENLQNYNIEFEYNGLKYECVKTEKELFPNKQNAYEMENSSKAKEKNEDRTKFNNSYATITGDKSITSNSTVGKSLDVGNNITNELTYSSKGNVSTLVKDTEYSVGSTQGKINPITGALMTSDTNTAECNFKDMYNLLPSGAREISNVNLGLYEREQPDLAIVTDIDNIKLSINGYEHTYNYKQRADFVSEGIPDLNAGYNEAMDGFSVYAKMQNDKYNKLSYNRAVYDSYIAYTKDNSQNENRLRMFVTYRIAVKNESSSLISRVSLRNYADTRYESVSDSYIYGANLDIKNQWKSDKTVSGQNFWETQVIAQNIPAGKCMYVYLTYEVSTQTIIDMAKLSPNGASRLDLDKNVTEISSYSTYDSSGKVYAGIDKDSAPNNITYGNTDTYEDDTDAAPDLYLTRKGSKQFSGLVFEDGTTNSNNLNTGSERLGNGICDNGENVENVENGVADVEVNLVSYNYNLDTNNDNVITLYTLDDNGNAVPKKAQSITGTDGKYNFTGFVPGEYYIIYTYGKYKYVDINKRDLQEENKQSNINGKLVTTQDYKSTIIDENTYRTLIDNNYNTIKNDKLWYWYENNSNFSKSSAVDDASIRTDINSYLSTITYGKKTAYEEEDYNGEHQVMKSYTGIIDIPVEDERSQQTDYTYEEGARNYQINFGIVERPRQSLRVTKEVDSIKLALANGQIIAEGNQDVIRSGGTKYVVYPEGGPLKIEIDNEIIEGSDLDINYKINIQNLSEVDYDNVNYYRYGPGKGNKYKTNIVTLKLDGIADYVDEKLSVTYDIDKNNSKFKHYSAADDTKDIWQLVQSSGKKENTLAGIDISPNVLGRIKNRNNIVVRKTDDRIGPNTSISYELLAKKKITSTSDNTFENYVELIEVYNSVGRFYGVQDGSSWKYETPGNFDVITKDNLEESDTNTNVNASKVTIIPPTGNNRIYYYVIGVSCLLILVAGIIIIKKKVL